jgi:proline racemase
MNISKIFTTIDTHTEGGPTRIITSGIPRLQGQTVFEKMDYFRSHFDNWRKLLMGAPRGHQGMFGAVLTEPVHPDADIGAFFLTNSGYLNMCVHSAIGVAAACLETGIIPKPRQNEAVKMETPTGIISLYPTYDNDSLKSITIQTHPAFVFREEVELDIGYSSPVQIDLVFSAVFFALLDIKQLGLEVSKNNIPELTRIGVDTLEEANRTIKVKHPKDSKIQTIELAMLYEDLGNHHARNAVISRTGSLDRSPCGAGTGAKMTYLYAKNKLNLNTIYTNESVLGTKFSGELMESVNVGSFLGAVPRISGSAYITGIHQFILDAHDPLDTGI